MLNGVEDRLSFLVQNARDLVDCGYYSRGTDRCAKGAGNGRRLLSGSLLSSAEFPIVAEVKLASPAVGRLSVHMAEELIEDYRLGGAAALSVITEPRFFQGSLRYLDMAARSGLPVMMKDFVVDGAQLRAASRMGASAVLLIQGVFGMGQADQRDRLISEAHQLGLEVVLESSSLEEMECAMASRADILAYNRRDLRTFRPASDGMETAMEIMCRDGRPSLAMSLMNDAEDVRRMRELGASGVLIGSALSASACPRSKLLSLRMPR